MSRIFVYPKLTETQDLNDILCRLNWYFRPYLDKIDAIHFTGKRAMLANVTRPSHMDPVVEDGLHTLKDKIRLLDPGAFDERIAQVDPARDMLLIWDESAEKKASPAIRAAIKTLSSRSGFYRVDPNRTRMEGSFYLWAGMNRYADRAALLTNNHARMKDMIAEIGQHEKAYVFGSGPSLSGFVEGHDFSDGISIISNSIVKNRDIIAKTRPRVITAADPIYHAGCSSYAGVFRDELIHALRETGAWFVCPMRDFAIYDAFLPEDLRPRIIGIPFDRKVGPPIHLGETFHLYPYPNVLTLALLPLASTLAKRVEIVGCDGRRLTDDGFFWSHDKKAQFNDKMAEIQAIHPAFFAIDYNDYYTEHCRDVETVLSAMEDAGKTVVTATPSMIPALHSREEQVAAGRADPAAANAGRAGTRTLVMIDPDAKGDWGHFLSYDKRLADGADANGLKTVLLGRSDLDPSFKPALIDRLIPCLSIHSWNLGKDWPHTHRSMVMTFAAEIETALDLVEAEYPEGEICVFMYVGSIEVAEILEYFLIHRPRVHAVVNLFWSYNFDQNAPDYRKVWYPAMRRLHGSGKVQLTHATPQIAEEYRRDWGLDIPALPHPSTTFADSEAASLAAMPGPVKDTHSVLKVLFPGGARSEKGFQLSMDTCAMLADDPGIRPVLRARLDKVSGPKLNDAYAALDKTGIDILDGELSEAEFARMIAGSDIVVIPYGQEAFRRRTSGILVDSFLLGKPVIVLEKTWLSSIVDAEGIGVTATPDAKSLAAAIRQAIARYESFRPALARAGQKYIAENSWKELVGMVVELSRKGPSPVAARVDPPPPPAKPDPKAPLRKKLRELIAAVPTRSPIFLPTEKLSLEKQVAGMERVKRLYEKELDSLYKPRMQALRERFKGTKRCFVIGNGPSLNRTDLSLLENEVTFAVNGFFLKAEDLNWKPTFYCVEDHLVAEDRVKWINEFQGPIKLFPAYLRYVFPQGKNNDTIFFNHRPRVSYPDGFDFSTRADEITYTGCTVTFTMLQLAFYFGFEEIYLIGVDADYEIPEDAEQASDYSVGVIDMKSDDKNHFHPDYFGKGFRWHDPQVHKMIDAYKEARRVVDGTDQRIYNATVGGRLEVFERRDFHALFAPAAVPVPAPPPKPADPAAWPKLLLLDMSAMGNGSATGEIKSSLLRDWPPDRVFQIADQMLKTLVTVTPGGADGHTATPATREEAAAAARAFDPDVILYRPVPNVPHLHDLAMDLIRTLDRPLVTWVMDDWLARLEAEDAEQYAVLGPDTEHLLKESRLRLSISDAMSEAFEARYGVPFRSLANGVDPDIWSTARRHAPGRLLVRYAGGLAGDMTLDSVLRVARMVERLGKDGTDIRFEIHTHKFWFNQSKQLFSGFKFTSIRTEHLSHAEYARWLARADVLLIAYNFDPASLRYVRYSMANKMPECLASGAVVLAHGPRGIATIDYLAGTEAAVLVTEQSDAAVANALRALATDPRRRNDLATRARRLAFERHDLRRLREELRSLLDSASRPGAARTATGTDDLLAATQQELAQLRQHFIALDSYVRKLEVDRRESA